MANMTVDQALEAVYTSLNNDNEDIDNHIANLKAAMKESKEILIDPARLTHNNRAGRKMIQSYFKKRGIIVTFTQ